MNIRSELLKIHSKQQTIKIAKYIGEDPQKFSILMKLFFKDENIVVQRSAWVVSYCSISHPQLLKPYLKDVLYYLEKPVHDAVKRNIVRVLQDFDIPRNLTGRLTNTCFRLLTSNKEAVAVKVFSMTILYNLTRNEPDLINELKIRIEDQLPYASPAFLSRGRKILNKIK
jgi:hypothetical protein